MSGTSTRTRKRKASSASTKPTEKSQPNTEPADSEPAVLNGRSLRSNATHVFFYGGILSNWHIGNSIPGSRIFELLLPELEGLNVSHPPRNAFSTKLLSDHMFNCGEQWMMAMKGWFFERDLETPESAIADRDNTALLGSSTPDKVVMSKAGYQRLRALVYEDTCPDEFVVDSKEWKLWASTIGKVLRTDDPKTQKAAGRQARLFDPEIWSLVSMPCVTAVCIARAELDPDLKEVYLSSGDRVYVEGSPRDKIWGVGRGWRTKEIENPALWNGGNRLGKCHNQAAQRIRQVADGDAVPKEEEREPESV